VTTKTGALSIDFKFCGLSRYVPVLVRLADSELVPLQEPVVMTVGESHNAHVDPGTYVVSVSVPSGVTLSRVVTIERGGHTRVTFALHELSPHDFVERIRLVCAALHGNSPVDARIDRPWLRLWRHVSHDLWTVEPIDIRDPIIYPDVLTLELHLARRFMHCR
jgi:hypothetical protein